MSRQATVFTRSGCHLCDDAAEMLRRYGFEVATVDVDGDPQLREKYDLVVPVVVIDGVERFRGRIDERLLRRLLRS